MTPDDLTAIGNAIAGTGALLAGTGTIVLAWIAYKGLNNWKAQATYKDEFNLAIKAVEVVCRAESALCNLNVPRGAYLLPSIAEDTLAKSLPRLLTVIEELNVISVSIEALFTKEESELFIKLSKECTNAHFQSKGFCRDVIEYSEALKEKVIASNNNIDTSSLAKHLSGLMGDIQRKKALFTKNSLDDEEDLRLSFSFQGSAKDAKQAMKMHLKRK